MKATWILIAVSVSIFIIPADVKAQESETMVYPHWVVEGNAFSRDYTLMRFYDERNQLIREEKLEGRFLDISRRKNVRMLNRRLRVLVDSLSLTGKQPNRKPKKKSV